MVIFRFFAILRVIARYRLDQLVPQQAPLLVRAALSIFKLLPVPKHLSRGERLRRAMQDLGPIFIKFGQLLSTRPDLVPDDIVQELSFLQDRVPPFDKDEFLHIVETSLGAPVDQVFAEFDREPLASASIAQVHTAVLQDGRHVVVKVVRPGIEKVIEKDVALLLVVARWVEKYTRDGKRLHPVEVVNDYQITILDELDLQREAANASQLRRNFLNSPLLYIPEIYWQYTRGKVLVMERIYGIPVTDMAALQAQNTNLKKLAERGVEIFFSQVFDHNFFHADMHPGNIFVSREHPELPQYIAVDMAIVGSLTKEDQYYLARNLIAMFRRDYRQVAELHVESGWVPSYVVAEELEAAIRTVCEPIFEKPLKDISFAMVLLTLFRTARRFDMEVQPQLVLLQKTLLNIEGLGRQLYPDLDLWETAHPYLERWLKERFSPKSLWKELKRHAPDWMEKFPQVPHLIFNNLQQLKDGGSTANQLRELREILVAQERDRMRRTRRTRIGVIALLTAAVTWPTFNGSLSGGWQQIYSGEVSAATLVLLAIGVFALVTR